MNELNWPTPAARRTEIIKHLTGEHSLEEGWSATGYPPAVTETGQGGKFRPDGKVLAYPGNTFICHIDQGSALFSALCDMQDELKSMHFADHFSFLPKSSFHMTIFCGISGIPLGKDGWPQGFERAVTLETINGAFQERLQDTTAETGISVLPAGLNLPATIEMKAASANDAQKLISVRRKLQNLTGIYRSDFETYRFHISMAYLIKWLQPSEAEFVLREAERLCQKHLSGADPTELGSVEFCAFETMHHFDVIQRLQDASSSVGADQ